MSQSWASTNKSGGVKITTPRHTAAPQPLCGRGDTEHKSPWQEGGNLSSTMVSILQTTSGDATKELLIHGMSGKCWGQLSERMSQLWAKQLLCGGGVFVNISTASTNTGFMEIWWSW